MQTQQYEELLAEINRDVPADVDWKAGAIDYLEQLIRCEGSANETYHLIKPFIGGPDFSYFFEEMYGFLNFVKQIDLPMKSKILDVACGPGWTSHYLAKLGYEALGVDISPDLIDLARKRVAMDAFAPYEGTPLKAEFMVHDVEEKALDVDTKFQAAFFESALHHFYDPIAAIKNISENLDDNGLLCIWEAVAPIRGSDGYKLQRELMEKYRTLERAYTREQLVQMLESCGFVYYEFFTAVNGLFNPSSQRDRDLLNTQLAAIDNLNICIASRSDHFFKNRSGPLCNHRNEETAGFWSLARQALQVDDGEAWLASLYRSVLGREPEGEGLEHHRKRVGTVAGRLLTVCAFLNSREYKQRKRVSTWRHDDPM